MSGIIPKDHIIKVHGLNFRFLHDFEMIFAGDFRLLDYHPESGRVLMEPVVSVVLGHKARELKGAFLRQVGEEQPIAIMAPPVDFLQADATKAPENCRHTQTEISIIKGEAREFCGECKKLIREGRLKSICSEDPAVANTDTMTVELDWKL